jgi:hypothetical protein
MRRVKKTKSGVPVKYLTGAKNKKAKEKEILETKKRYEQGRPINIKKVSQSRANQGKKTNKRSR